MKKAFLIIFILFSTLAFFPVLAQEKKIVQFSGLVVGGDSLYGVPDVAVYVPRTGRGIFTNQVGYFSIPTLSGDTVSIKAIGFQERTFVIPDSAENISAIIQLEVDTVMLPEIVLWPYPTFESFKQAFLALENENKQVDFLAKNLDPGLLNRMMANMEASPGMNQRYFMVQQVNKTQYRYQAPTISLLNPFAWARFIKDVQSGGLKNKQWEEIDKRKHEEKDE